MKNLAKTKTNKDLSFGTLYHHSMGLRSASVTLNPRPRSVGEKTRRAVGAGLTSVAMALYIYSYGPFTSAQLQSENVSTPAPITIQTEVSAAPALEEAPQSTEFLLTIPFLHTDSIIIPNVDPSNEGAYSEALSRGVAQAQGTGVPGEGKRIFLFAHSTNSPLNIERYNAIFYDLGKVPEGEVISISYHGKKYSYKVSEKKVVSASEVQWLAPKEGEALILQTCYPPGTNWKRLLVFAQPIS